MQQHAGVKISVTLNHQKTKQHQQETDEFHEEEHRIFVSQPHEQIPQAWLFLIDHALVKNPLEIKISTESKE